jgi:arsenate reductase
MAEALLRELGGAGWEVRSAGTAPTGLNPLTVAALREIGIDVSGAESKHLDRFLDDEWDYVITVCDQAREACPLFLGGGEQLHWSFPDPAAATGRSEERLEAFRHVRELIRARVETFLRARRIPVYR